MEPILPASMRSKVSAVFSSLLALFVEPAAGCRNQQDERTQCLLLTERTSLVSVFSNKVGALFIDDPTKICTGARRD